MVSIWDSNHEHCQFEFEFEPRWPNCKFDLMTSHVCLDLYHKRLFLPETLNRKWCCRVHDDIKHLLTPGESTGFKQWATPSIPPMPMTTFFLKDCSVYILYSIMTTAWMVKSTLKKKNRFEVIMQTLVTLDLHHYEGCHSDLDRAWMISCPDSDY